METAIKQIARITEKTLNQIRNQNQKNARAANAIQETPIVTAFKLTENVRAKQLEGF